ncbi:TPA: hypothetical protein N0F65_003180 [Lagenidium giganteum]|uniref:Uncharacterized protein n=1 Tax=Lagenidium giganteum TaxID=4803 RepID=A0AAV2Z8C5_9STRA|nr:TPA: hypothetical protein N0F65_003180 [Lagenidium giganteum]
MQVLLLDTTEKEGEDNKLYHYCASTIRDGAHSKQTSGAWLELRGVLAAAVGATTAICGEELQSAVLRVGQVGHVGIINLDAVVFVLVLDVSVPVQIVEVSHLATSEGECGCCDEQRPCSAVLRKIKLLAHDQSLRLSGCQAQCVEERCIGTECDAWATTGWALRQRVCDH